MIKYNLSKQGIGTLNVTRVKKSYTFGYPCNDSFYECTPYTVTLNPGDYQIEAWGSVGHFHVQSDPAIPGLGGYTSGVQKVNNTMNVYLFVGSTAFFNLLKQEDDRTFWFGGASSDIRLYVNESFEWSDPSSLRSRIMVSGGGGGAEWTGSIGGNAGGLIGGFGRSDCHTYGFDCTSVNAGGGAQTFGGSTAKSVIWISGISGLFGKSPINYAYKDMGGIGGNLLISRVLVAVVVHSSQDMKDVLH